jgi:hypothetical protein
MGAAMVYPIPMAGMHSGTPQSKGQTMDFYQRIASLLQARANCEKSGNAEWFAKHTETIEDLCSKHLPHGSGFDSGCKFDVDASTPNRLVFSADFHHMDDHGYYDGWTTHQVIVTPDLAHGYSMRVTGRDKHQIKDYIADTFHHAMVLDV